MSADLIRDGLQALWAAAAERDLDDLSRANRARVAVETAEDLAALIRSSAAVFPGRGLATIRAALDQKVAPDVRNPGSAAVRGVDPAQVVEVGRNLDAMRPAVRRALGDFEGLGFAAGGPIPALGSPFNAAPLIAAAEPLLTVGRFSNVVPGLPAGVVGKVAPVDGDFSPDDDTVSIDDVGGWPDLAGLSVLVADQVVDWTDDAGAALLDRMVVDAVDAAAEAHIGTLLLAAAGTPTPADDDLAGVLDAAEGATASVAQATTGLVVVNPDDWPKVRRVMAPAWQIGPRPTPMVSVAAPAGTVLVVGGGVLRVEAGAPSYMSVLATSAGSGRGPRTPQESATVRNVPFGSQWLSCYRYFRAVIRASAGVQAITL